MEKPKPYTSPKKKKARKPSGRSVAPTKGATGGMTRSNSRYARRV